MAIIVGGAEQPMQVDWRNIPLIEVWCASLDGAFWAGNFTRHMTSGLGRANWTL
jgi:hypothetical protein